MTPEKDPAQRRTRMYDGQKCIDMHALAYIDIHFTPRHTLAHLVERHMEISSV